MKDLTIISPFLDYVNVLAGSHWYDLDNKVEDQIYILGKFLPKQKGEAEGELLRDSSWGKGAC